MSNKHSWFKYCIDTTAFDKIQKLDKFLLALKKQSNNIDALIPYREDLRMSHTDEDNKSIKAPRYFGAGVEALSEVFFETFGLSDYNLGSYISMDTIDEDLEDTGYDATANTSQEKSYGKRIRKISKSGSPVYLQVKGSLNPTKEHTTNDGSRVMNFFGNAQGHARMSGQGCFARYILFTTAKGLHYKLEANTFGDIEVINYKKISKKINGNPFFWNEFRKKLGIMPLLINGPKDPEWETMQNKLKEEDDLLAKL
jgi:hypothetical protein